VNFLDLLVIAAAAAAGVIGYRMGFLRRLASWTGLVGGLVLAVVLVDDVADLLRGTPPRTRLLGALAFVLLCATAGQAIGYAIGSALHRTVGRNAPLRSGDRVAGAVLGVTGVLTLMWLLIPALASSPGWPARAVRDSAVARAIDRLAPTPPDDAEALGRLVGDQSLPEVFDTLTSPDAGTPPQHGVPVEVAKRVSASVVKVEGAVCDRIQEGTGFFAAPGLVVTNAHVVAGLDHPRVETQDGRHADSDVVAFDGNRDVAVLAVDLDVPPLVRADGHVDDLGSLFGHPEGGPLREASMRIAQEISARGTNIDHTAPTTREVFVLAAVAEPGDSGAPVVNTNGDVVGVLFAFDLSQPDTSYALTDSELDAVLDPVIASHTRHQVGTGQCLAE
jgi:S1-C subfamily serine protease